MSSNRYKTPFPNEATALPPSALTAQALDYPSSHIAPLQSDFLALPAELRNAICAYALSAPSPLLYRPSRQPDTRGTLHEAAQIRQFNQLKYVNRQLRTETEDLEIQHSEIAFRQAKYSEDYKPDVLMFACKLQARKLQWVTNVILAPSERWLGIVRDTKEMFKAWETLATHFGAHPHISIKYIVPSFRSTSVVREDSYARVGRFVTIGSTLAEIVQGHNLWYLKKATLGIGNYVSGSARLLQKDKARELRKRLPNFRIFPEQDALTALWIHSALINILRLNESISLLLHWILMATEWMERGI